MVPGRVSIRKTPAIHSGRTAGRAGDNLGFSPSFRSFLRCCLYRVFSAKLVSIRLNLHPCCFGVRRDDARWRRPQHFDGFSDFEDH
jgi:hypothetical protein